MPLPRVSLRSFLLSAKNALRAPVPPSSPITLVIGNESADLDSLCSAIVLAYLRTYAPKSNTFYIPLSNLPRADLTLRPELIPVLSHANLEPNDLITLSDLPALDHVPSKLPPERTRWIVVDHNSLQGDLGRVYGSRVAGCIDHHDEEGKVPTDCGEEPRVVQKSGSCSSLVVEYCRQAWDTLSRPSEDKGTASWGVELARLALAPILIDTTNLADKHKTMPVDIKATEYLESRILADPESKYNREQYFQKVTAAKNDIGGLSLPDILRKDYKQWTEDGSVKLGISSVVKDMQFLLDKAGSKLKFFAALSDFAKERDLSICSIMTASNINGAFRRELLVWGLDERGRQAAEMFVADASETLDLRQWGEGSLDVEDNTQWRRCWWQPKAEYSRKQVAPLLRAAIESSTK